MPGKFQSKTIDWNKVYELKSQGLRWDTIAAKLDIPYKNFYQYFRAAFNCTPEEWWRGCKSVSEDVKNNIESGRAAANMDNTANSKAQDIGDPIIEDFVTKVHKAASVLTPLDEIAGLLDMSEEELNEKYMNATGRSVAEGVRPYYCAARQAIRRQQFKALYDGSVAAAFWLGRQYLAQTDEAPALSRPPRPIVFVQPLGSGDSVLVTQGKAAKILPDK